MIVAGPAVALVRQWEAELTVIRRRSPSSDAAMTLTTCIRELMEAIRAGRDTRLHLTIADVHATSGIPVSTLRWLCKHKSDLVGAQKHEGVWYFDRAKFERYLSTSDREVPLDPRHDQRAGRLSGRRRQQDAVWKYSYGEWRYVVFAMERRDSGGNVFVRWTNTEKSGFFNVNGKVLTSPYGTLRLDDSIRSVSELPSSRFSNFRRPCWWGSHRPTEQLRFTVEL